MASFRQPHYRLSHRPKLKTQTTACRVVAVDRLTSLVIIQDEKRVLTVDLRSAVGSEDGYLPNLKDLVMITGHLVVKTVSLLASTATCPVFVVYARSRQLIRLGLDLQSAVIDPKMGIAGANPNIWDDRMLDAVLIKPCEELDQHAWRESVRLASST